MREGEGKKVGGVFSDIAIWVIKILSHSRFVYLFELVLFLFPN